MDLRVLARDEQAYKNMSAIAKMLEAVSPNNAEYRVENTYFDFGQNWVWTTICRYGCHECQILSPRQWEQIVAADNIERLAVIAEDIRNDKYFMDIKEV